LSLYDSVDLLARVQRLINRPSTDAALTSTEIYPFLGEAQQRVVGLIAQECPEAMYGAPTKLATADSGATYTFGADSATGGNISPIGHIELRESPTGAMIPPGSEWDTDTQSYLFESDKIRWPGQKTRTFSDGPYARFITMPGLLDGTNAPTLKPIFARELLVYDACERAAVRLGIDPTPYGQMFDARWPELLMTIVTQYSGAGRTAVAGDGGGVWWKGRTA
jgi:hypothetical protein